MLRHRIAIITVVLSLSTFTSALGDDVRYYQKDGVTYRETRQVIQRPVLETQMRETTQTFYREQFATETKETTQEGWVPVTEYRLEAYWVGRWNPFVEPYLAYRNVPYTRWERVTRVVKTPVTNRKLVPETRTVQVPVTTQRMVDQEIITRVAVSHAPSHPTHSTGTAVANNDLPWTAPTLAGKLVPVTDNADRIGGMARLESDPPRQGVSTAWRASSDERR